jgi:hypothetical protein
MGAVFEFDAADFTPRPSTYCGERAAVHMNPDLRLLDIRE